MSIKYIIGIGICIGFIVWIILHFIPHLSAIIQTLGASASALIGGLISPHLISFVSGLFKNAPKATPKTIVDTEKDVKDATKQTHDLWTCFVKWQNRDERKIDEFIKDAGQEGYKQFLKDSLMKDIFKGNGRFENDENVLSDVRDRLRMYSNEVSIAKHRGLSIEGTFAEPEVLMHMQQRNLEDATKKPDGSAGRDMPGRYVLKGNAGSGKSFYLKHLALKTLECSPKAIPIYIQPWNWTGRLCQMRKVTIVELAAYELHKILQQKHKLHKIKFSKVQKYLEQKLMNENETVSFFIDDFDKPLSLNKQGKIDSQEKRLYDNLVDDIKKPINDPSLRHDLPPSIWIAARNTLHIPDFKPDYWVIEDLLRTDTRFFIKIMIERSFDEKAGITVQRLFDRDARFQAMAMNALGLIATNTLLKTEPKPHLQRARLYKDFIIDIHQRINRSASPVHGANTSNGPTDPCEEWVGLQELAWQMHDNNRWLTDEKEINLLLLSSQAAQRKGIEAYTEQCGLLVATDADGGPTRRYCFLNFPLQEYLVASYLISNSFKEESVLEKYKEPWWQEVILLYICLYCTSHETKDITRLIDTIIDKWHLPTSNAQLNYYAEAKAAIMAGRVLEMLDAQKPKVNHFSDIVKLSLFRQLNRENSLYVREPIARAITSFEHSIDRRFVTEIMTIAQAQSQNGHAVDDTFLSDYANHIPNNESLCPLLLPYLSVNQINRANFFNIATYTETNLEDLLTAPVKQTEPIFAAFGVLAKYDLASGLTKLLEDNERGRLYTAVPALKRLLDEGKDITRASIARTIGTIGSVEEIGELLRYLSTPKKIPARILWNVADALGMLGERLGYSLEGSSIEQGFSEYMKRKDGEPYILLKMELIFITKIDYRPKYEIPVYKDKDNNHLPSAAIPMDSTARDLFNIMKELTKGKDKDGNEVTKTLTAISKKNPKPEVEEWIYICDVIGQLAYAGDDTIFKALERHCAAPELNGYARYARWLASRRG